MERRWQQVIYLMKRLSIAIERGNVAEVLGSLGNACNNDRFLVTFLHVFLNENKNKKKNKL